MNPEKFEKPKKGSQEKPKIRRVCAWCGKNMGEEEAAKEMVTHGICPECRDEFLKGVEEEKKKWKKVPE